ncbi:MAG TPA: type II toxin-antitoxin system prevent-host-death family antitoxin [Candidatus Tyrphobacter sp.]
MKIGIYEARARLGELVRMAGSGKRVVIEVRGEPAAQLTAVEPPADKASAAARRLIERARRHGPWGVTARELIVEGRRE